MRVTDDVQTIELAAIAGKSNGTLINELENNSDKTVPPRINNYRTSTEELLMASRLFYSILK